MKLYTEEQIIEFSCNIASYHNYSIEDMKEMITRDLTPIELPSDEEIEEYASKYSADGAIIHGAKWMKTQILNQNK